MTPSVKELIIVMLSSGALAAALIILNAKLGWGMSTAAIVSLNVMTMAAVWFVRNRRTRAP